ncbi:glycosyltransferase family 2 protein [Stenotrophomonas oahuensis]|uniref:Glycosyltransferase family 2 protein n=1 Tax=Stenotrophomonas oahuensis TaxID=3003271 RepID=A0ABY9YIU3_9GAMM|nr:glycosyltransferase family 2 protein [Stenotrophomonas sp. A5586]WNH50788.1 glycosyltransferase family 2 protein [Stenotrophomonas sp. A5586]
MHIDVSVVVPVYSATRTLEALLGRLALSMEAAALAFELILVDDRGNPDSWGAIRSMAQKDPRVVGLRLGRNFGQHAATMCGIGAARGAYVVTMDEDLEHPPEAIPSLLRECSPDQPLVYGVFPTRTHARFRNATSELMRWSLKKSFPDMNQAYTSFRALHHSLAKRLGDFQLNRPYIDGMLSWLTASVGTVTVAHGQRDDGRSAYTLRKLISHATNIFVTFSNLPLRLASYMGAALAASSFIYLLVVIFERLTGRITDPGYASLMCVILFACGIQLVILGVLGEYVGRLMSSANRRPMYSVQETTLQDLAS